MKKNTRKILNTTIYIVVLLLIIVEVKFFIVPIFQKRESKKFSNPRYEQMDTNLLGYTDIAKDPKDIPPSDQRDYSKVHEIEITAKEIVSVIEEDKDFIYFTYNETVPGPFLRVRVNDTILLTFKNDANNYNHHSIDLHAVTGPGGGATITQIEPGESRTIRVKTINEGLYVYHCATPLIPGHIANGMYGLILVEPAQGLPKVDKEFYVMQGEIYQNDRSSTKNNVFYIDEQDLEDENPSYIIFNGRVESLIDNALEVNQGDRVRIFLGNGGVSRISSFHIIGEIFDKIYPQGSLTHTLENVQVAAIFPGGSNMVEFTTEVKGSYILVDHALSRLLKGASGSLIVKGESPTDDLYSIER